MAAASAEFVPLRLTLAREASGLTKTELAKSLGLSAAAMTQFESGRTSPSDETMSHLQRRLGYPPDFYYRAITTRLEADACHFRRQRGATKREQRKVLAKGALLLHLADFLTKYVNLPPVALKPPGPRPRTPDDIERIALGCREDWQLGLGPIENVVKLLETKGVLVLELLGAGTTLDAFSTWSGGRALAFLGAEKGSASRRRFDAAHELGHLLMHKPGQQGPDIESEAHRFAAAFLLPREPFERECPSRLNWFRLRELKSRWKVSLAALVTRAYHLGIYSTATYRRAFVQLGAKGWRRNEPDEPPFESASLLRRALDAVILEYGPELVESAQGTSVRHLMETLIAGAQEPDLGLC